MNRPEAHCPLCGAVVPILDRKIDPDEQQVRCARCIREAIQGGPIHAPHDLEVPAP